MSLDTSIRLPIFLIPLLSLPIRMNRYSVLLYSLVLGLVMDIFSFSLGLFSTIVVFLGFLRVYILDFIVPNRKASLERPTVKVLGLPLFIFYVGVHYFLFFTLFVFLEYFHLKSLWYNLSFILFNTMLNIVAAMIMDSMSVQIQKKT